MQWRPDPTFYPSPTHAMEAPTEKLAKTSAAASPAAAPTTTALASANWWSIAEVTLTAALGVAALAAGFQGWALKKATGRSQAAASFGH